MQDITGTLINEGDVVKVISGQSAGMVGRVAGWGVLCSGNPVPTVLVSSGGYTYNTICPDQVIKLDRADLI